MALEDFYGRYQVQATSGTEFGLGTLVEIADDGEGLMVGFALAVDVETGQDPTDRLVASYDQGQDALIVPLSGNRSMSISRYPDLGDGYHGIYSVVIGPAIEGEIRRLPVWTAKRLEPGIGPNQGAAGPADGSGFVGDYRIFTTADTQFGIGSKVEITGSGPLSLQIWNALGDAVAQITPMVYDPTTITLHGAHVRKMEGPEGMVPVTVVVALSLAEEDGVNYLYGNFTIDDPEQAGTFGGEEDNPGTAVDD